MYEIAISLLRRLREMLAEGHEFAYLHDLDSALEGDDAVLTAFLASNRLWGGAGSIADQASAAAAKLEGPWSGCWQSLAESRSGLAKPIRGQQHGPQFSTSGTRKTSNHAMELTGTRVRPTFSIARTIPLRATAASGPGSSSCSR